MGQLDKMESDVTSVSVLLVHKPLGSFLNVVWNQHPILNGQGETKDGQVTPD